MPRTFVPQDLRGSRKDTAVLLVGTAGEFGIPTSDITVQSRGFLISQRLADVLYDEGIDINASGNRAAKAAPRKKGRTP